MNIKKQLLSAFVISTFSTNIFASSLISPPDYTKGYVTITGYLGTRVNEDLKNQETDEIAKFSSELTQAIALGWTYERNSEGELLFSNSKQFLTVSEGSLPGIDVYVQYLHFGGKILFSNNTPFSTNIGLGAGLTHFNPAGSDYDADLAFSGNISGGVRYQINDKFALRGDLRVYGTLLNSDSTLFCGNNNCYLNVDGDIYVQTELMAGIEYKF